MKKPVKIGLWLLGLAMLGLLGLWLEHERAKARLAAFKADLIAKGEKLAIADHVPKLPPALSNAAPDFIAAANRLTELKAEWQPGRMRMVAPGKARVTWRQAELPTNVESDIWPFIIAHVEDNRPLLAEMAAALQRPEMVVNLDYSKGVNLKLPHVEKHRRAVFAMANATLVDLRNGHRAAVFTNLLAAIRLNRLTEEPLLVSQLLRIACGHIAVTATWEALQFPGWQDRQLRAFQEEWEAWDVQRGWLASANLERSWCSDLFAQFRAYPGILSMRRWGSSEARPGEKWHVEDSAVFQVCRMTAWMIWFSYEDERTLLKEHQLWLDGARQALKANSFARTASALNPSATPPPIMWVSRQMLPGLSRIHVGFAKFETVRRLTVTAIALHRHRLKHGGFPASLGALVPEFLAEVPRDFMDGQPLRYRLEPDGQFLLWSVGEDFKDDGGDPTPVGAQSTNPFDWLKGRDWVWPQAATEAEVAAHHAELEAKRAKAAPPPP